ncbi:ABC transporter ATP-binding protein [Mesomycoplasma conjunctivae]|uniref:Oligopeptide ABC transporter ATP binding prote n=1 Tax=Mesomycoplasma conjunctivae (strain ATCC 25834 / NCTC 10147 / HRC/581) TaxID=572263 RepID=C5J639_MESCH|nr:ABC transporter ATP-binding protein [Mesomycoplasma conjunctivae]CAT04931.1 Oligopeptide ABC transporter ATP binding prote [Mesomycoplasma conjunctivae]VEU66071.1 ABC transporter ATP-binding protein [Mesomycoplasma conjunctivae]
MNDKILNVKNLRVKFRTGHREYLEIIRGVNLSIRRGQIIALVGESGSGKSVTSKSLLGINAFAKTTSDAMLIDGIDASKFEKDRQWRTIRGKKIGYIPQDPLVALNPTRTIGKQLLDSLKNDKRFKNKQEKKEYLINLLESFGISEAQARFNSYPHTLSGGQKQRVVIAMVIAAQPSIIIADEPTTALDPTVQSSVLALLNDIRIKHNISIIFISHNISIVAKFCDYIYVMYSGKVIEKGTRQDIFTDPRHPYTWALISAIPETSSDEALYTISGNPPDMKNLTSGDPFAPRNDFALALDFEKEPPLIQISKTHYAATWLLHPEAPKVELNQEVKTRIKLFKEVL